MNPLTAKEIARRRLVERFECSGGKGRRGHGEITLAGRTFKLDFDDLFDLALALETISWRLTGKVLADKFTPEVKNRAALQFTRIAGGDYSAYTGSEKAPMSNYTVCDVTDYVIRTSFLRIDIEGNAWENWFCRLDELLKCLYIIVREAQGDPYVPRPAIYISKRPQDNLLTLQGAANG